MKKAIYFITIVILVLFGLLTLFLSGSVIFDLFGIRQKEGNFVWFIVYTNFFCSFLYLITAYGFVKKLFWTTYVLYLSIIILIVAFIGLLFYINNGGLYKMETFYGMIFRIVVTILLTISSKYYTIRNQSIKSIL